MKKLVVGHDQIDKGRSSDMFLMNADSLTWVTRETSSPGIKITQMATRFGSGLIGMWQPKNG